MLSGKNQGQWLFKEGGWLRSSVAGAGNVLCLAGEDDYMSTVPLRKIHHTLHLTIWACFCMHDYTARQNLL